MSKIGNWIMEMEEDAIEMCREEFIQYYGKSQCHIWERVNAGETGQSRSIQYVNTSTGDEIPF
jgi:hypothetical protein